MVEEVAVSLQSSRVVCLLVDEPLLAATNLLVHRLHISGTCGNSQLESYQEPKATNPRSRDQRQLQEG